MQQEQQRQQVSQYNLPQQTAQQQEQQRELTQRDYEGVGREIRFLEGEKQKLQSKLNAYPDDSTNPRALQLREGLRQVQGQIDGLNREYTWEQRQYAIGAQRAADQRERVMDRAVQDFKNKQYYDEQAKRQSEQSRVFTPTTGQLRGSTVVVTSGKRGTVGEKFEQFKRADVSGYQSAKVIGGYSSPMGDTIIFDKPLYGATPTQQRGFSETTLARTKQGNFQDQSGKVYNVEYQPQQNERSLSSGYNVGSDVLVSSDSRNNNRFDFSNKASLSTYEEAKQELKIFEIPTGINFSPTPKGKLSSSENPFGLGLEATRGFFVGVTSPVLKTKETFLGFKETLFHPFDSAKGMIKELETEPVGTLGEIGGQTAFFKGVVRVTPQVVKNQVPRFTVDTVVVPTETSTVSVRTLGVQQGVRGVPLVSVIKETPVVTDAVPVASRTVVFGSPKSAVVAVASDQAVAFSPRAVRFSVSSEGRMMVSPGSAVLPRDFSSLTSGFQTPVSVGASKVLERSVFDLPESDAVRPRSAAIVASELQPDKGLRVRNPVFNVESLPESQRGVFSKSVERITGEEGGVFFGSGTTQQLPSRFANKVIGDVDLFFPARSSADIGGKVIPRYVGELNTKGIKVRQSKANPKVIEDFSGNKILEAKSGLDVDTLVGEETALAGFRGVRFADIKAGQSPDTVAFGSARAITAGEQTARKAAASSFYNPPASKLSSSPIEGLPESFSKGGIFGKVRANDPRTLKDVAGFLQGAEGLLELRSQANPVKRILDIGSTARARSALETYKGSFTPEQLADINLKMQSLTGEKTLLITKSTERNIPGFSKPEPISASPVFVGESSSISVITSPSSSSPSSNNRFVSPSLRSSPSIRVSPRFSPSISSSPRFSPSPSRIVSSSPSLSPRLSPSLSPRSSPSPSPRLSSSPSLSPRFSSSPSLSPRSPLSPSPSPSPRSSPSPSPRFSPSPSFLIPRRTTPIYSPKPNKDDNKGSFGVLVRRGGKFTSVGSGLSLDAALLKGERVTGGTAAASFKVVGGSGSLVRSRAGELLRNKRYYESKKEPLVFIQKNQYRISTGGEKQEITEKGLLAVKRKKRRGLF